MTTSPTSFEVRFADLWTYHGTSESEPIAQLAGADSHVHGTLEIFIQGKPLPSLGYMGPNDVCLGVWAVELLRLTSKFSQGSTTRYIYAEGEQGQPAFQFDLDGPDVLVSLLDGSGGGPADPAWHGIRCRLSDLVASVEIFRQDLRSTLIDSAGERGEAWSVKFLGNHE